MRDEAPKAPEYLMVAKDIGRETVTYVDNVYKYYVAYKLAAQQAQVRQNAKRTAGDSRMPFDASTSLCLFK